VCWWCICCSYRRFDPWIDVGGVSGWWFSVASCGRVEVGVADVKRKGEDRSGGSIDELRSQSKEGVVATLSLSYPDIYVSVHVPKLQLA
jgi:hypothetical protein